MDWMLMPLRRYADFSGRSRRTEYWMFVLGYTIVLFVLGILAGVLSAMSGDTGQVSGGAVAVFGLLVLIMLALFIPALAVQVRRLHDQDKSGWFLLLSLVPFGGLVIFIFMCMDGTPGPNRYGPDPKGRGGMGYGNGYGQMPPQGYGQMPPGGYGPGPQQGYGQMPPQGYGRGPGEGPPSNY